MNSPLTDSFPGSVFDHTYLAYSGGSQVSELSNLLQLYTPLGLIVADHAGTRETVKPKPNHSYHALPCQHPSFLTNTGG